MANLKDDLQEILDADGPLGPLIDFDLGVGDQPKTVDNAGADFFEEWAPELSQFGINPAILLPGTSNLQAVYNEPDAPHDLDHTAGFTSSSILFPQDPTQQFLPADPSQQFYEQGRFDTGSFVEQYPSNISSISGNLMIDPQLENSGSSEYDNYQDILGTPDANTFTLPNTEGGYDLIDLPSAAPIAPMGQLISAEHLTVPIPNASPDDKGNLVLKTKITDPMDNCGPKLTKAKGKGKAPVTGGRVRNRPTRRVPLSRTSGNSAGSDLDDGIDLEKIAGTGRGSLSTPQAFSQSVGFGQEIGPEAYFEDSHFDSDETIDLEEYTTACHTGVSSIGESFSCVNLPRLEYEREASTEAPSDILNGDLSLLQPISEESSNSITTSTPTVPAKRGRGRPIVPGSKRQRRIQAMAQPDYVPPKRGRPRTSAHGQRKRIRRAKVSQPVFLPLPEFVPQPVAQFMSEDPGREYDDLSFNLIYKPVILNNEIGYTPDQFILEPMQAEKIQQIYDVELPPGGWVETIDRWRLTFNLNRITPPSSVLYQELSDIVKQTQFKATDAGNKENIGPDEDITEPNNAAELAADVGPLLQKPAAQTEMETAMTKENVFPDQHLKIVTGDGTHHVMTHEQVLEKLLDERDVYFRAIVWELIQGAQRIGSMEFVGSWNRMSGVWEFV